MEYLHCEPYPHQLQAVEMSKTTPSMALLWEMGTGKTRASIDICRDKYMKQNGLLRTLIFTPQVTMFNWQEEFLKFSKIPERYIRVLTGSGKQRVKNLVRHIGDYEKPHNRILITNWESVQNDEVWDRLCVWQPQIIIGDELHLIKNPRSKRAKKAVMLADICRENNGYIYGLTGTSILNSVEDLFMQYRFLDGGKRLMKNFTVFRKRYMIDISPSYLPYPDWQPREETFEELNSKIMDISIRKTKSEVLKDLPPLVVKNMYVEMSKEQKKLYKEMQNDFIAFIDGKINEGVPRAAVANIALTRALRLMQIVSGFVTDEEGQEYTIEDNPRLKITEELLTDLTPNHKVILWCSYKNNYKVLSNLCDKLGLKYVLLTGDPKLNKHEQAKSFQEDGEIRVCIANRRAGGIGINLTAASYSIVFSKNFSLGEEKQSEARNHRGGSQIHESIVKINLVAKETIDEKVNEALANKQSISDKIIDWGKE